MDAGSRPERDLFPWLAGSLCAVTSLLAVGISAYHPFEPPSASSAALIAVNPALRAGPTPSAASDPAPPPSLSQPPPARSQPAASTPPPLGAADAPPSTRIWECAANGVRIFSDAPCGAQAVARDIAEPNRMDTQRVLPAAVSYGYPDFYPAPDEAGDAPGWATDNVLAVAPYFRHRPGHPFNRGSGSAIRPRLTVHH